MAGPLAAAGAVSEPSEYATLSMDRNPTGLYTQRSPLRDADVPYLQMKFYSATRFDSIIDGINREITSHLTDGRRAGSSPYNSNTFPAINSFYPWKYIQNGSEIIRVIADGTDGNVYDATAGQKTALFTKSAGAGKARFLGVNTELFFGDGVDQMKIVRSSIVWAATAAFTVGQFIVDTNLNLQQVTTAGTSSGTAPTWATALGTTTTDGTVTWTCKGSAVQNWGITAPATAPTVANAALAPTTPQWAASTFYLQDDFLLDSNGNLQMIYASGTTGTATPTWSTTTGALTTDGTCTWLNLGTATRANSQAYYGAVSTTLINLLGSTGSQTVTVGSLANIHVGKVLIVDAGTSMEPVVVTAINATNVTFTAVFAETHAASVAVVAQADTIAYNYSISYTIEKGDQAWTYTNYYRDFFQCTKNGTSSAATTFLKFQPGAGSTTSDATVTWTNIGQQLVWNSPYTNPDGSVSQIVMNAGGTAVKVSNAQQIQDGNGYLQNVTVSGLSGATAPTWSLLLGGNTVDNKVTWSNAGVGTASNGSLPWIYGYSFRNDVTFDTSTSSAQSDAITLNSNSSIVIQGQGSGDPQVGTIRIWRTAQGGSTLIFLDDIANPGAGNTWTYVDTTLDTDLNALIPAPIDNQNDPPPVGLSGPVYHLQRIWGFVGNTVYYSGGPDTITGSGNTAWPPLNFIPYPEQIIRLMPFTITNGGVLVITTSNVYVILGTGTSSNPFYTTIYMPSVGIAGYDALDVVGSTFYMMTGKGKFISLDPSAGYVEAGFPIGDQFATVTTGAGSAATGELYSPSTCFVSWHEQSSADTAIYVSDGAVGWFRFSPVASPESGYLWSPRAAILGGTSAVQSVETSPGKSQLLIGPPAGGGPILFRDNTVNVDWNNVSGTYQYAGYPSWDVKGNIVLCQSGELAEIAHIALKSTAVGARPIVSLLLGEIAASTATPFEALSITGNDPPELPPSKTIYSDRYTAMQNGICPKCDNFQMKVDYGTQNFPDELLMFSIYGAKHAERKQQ